MLLWTVELKRGSSGRVNDTGTESASAENSSASSKTGAGRRILLLSLGAVDDGVFGLESSLSSESSALDRRPVTGAIVVVLRCPEEGRGAERWLTLSKRRQLGRRDLT